MDTKINNLHFYDEVIMDIMANLSSESQRTNNEIQLKWFNFNRSSHRVYLHVAQIISTFYHLPIYINCSFFNYIKFILTHWKMRKQFHWIRESKVPLAATPVQAIIDHIEIYREMRPESNLLWDSILYTYYEKKKGETNESNSN